MSKINKSELEDEYKARPVQNFPDYLKYVAKKSKAGFGKVHEELYRLYSESFGTSEKPAQQSPDNRQELLTENRTSKSKVSLRKRWSNTSLFWSPTGHDKVRTTTYDDKSANNSFVSYLPEEKESYDSSTGSTHDYEILPDDQEMIKHDNLKVHNTQDNDKKESKLNRLRFSMPHSTLTEEAIYTNDRVLHVEKIANLNKIEEEEEESPAEQSIPKKKLQREKSHEIDDYVNLRTSDEPLADIIDTMKTNSRKELKKTRGKLLKSNTLGAPNKSAAAKQTLVSKKTGISGDSDEDDEDYLPPTNWTQSCYTPSLSIKLETDLFEPKVKQLGSPLVKSPKLMSNSEKSETNDNDKVSKDDCDGESDENYYVLPSNFKDPDYENIPKVITNNKLAVSNENTKEISSGQQAENNVYTVRNKIEDHADYDRPKNWLQSVDNCKKNSLMPTTVSKYVTDIRPVRNETDEGTEDLYTKVVKNQTNSLDGDYSVPKSTKLITKTDRTDGLYTKIINDQKRDSSDGDYSVPTFTKLTAKDYIAPGTGNQYSVPRGVRPVNSGNVSALNVKQSNYSVLRSDLITNGDSPLTNHKIDDVKTNHANENANVENSMVEFYNYSVDEVVDCLHECALTKLANICKEEQLDGEYFRTLKADDLQRDPFHMNWYHVSKLFKVIGGWRPKTVKK